MPEPRCGGQDGKDGRRDWLAMPLAWQRTECGKCPLQFECLEFALEVEQGDVERAARESGKSPHAHLGHLRRFGGGVYGGLTVAERSKIIAGRLGVSPARIKSEPGDYESCGSYSGYQNHGRLGEWACDRCLDAHRSYQQKRRKRLRSA